jgi:hypothetical protein
MKNLLAIVIFLFILSSCIESRSSRIERQTAEQATLQENKAANRLAPKIVTDMDYIVTEEVYRYVIDQGSRRYIEFLVAPIFNIGDTLTLVNFRTMDK